MKLRRFQKTDLLWLTGILALLAFQFWYPEVGSRAVSDTWSNTASGKRAFYLLAQQESPDVSRNYDALEESVYWWSNDWDFGVRPTVCLLGPAREPTESEWQALLDWVSGGGRLVYATPAGTGEFKIPGVISTSDSADKGEKSTGLEGEALHDVLADSAENQDQFAWRQESTITSNSSIDTLLVSQGAVQAVRISRGAGTLVFISGDSIFSNEYLAYRQNPVLAWRLIEAAGDTDWIVFDESLNDTGTSKMMGILLAMPIRPVTLLLLLVVCLYAWMLSHRFGPYLEESVEPRRNIVDHTDMMGNLLYNGRQGSHALKLYFRQLILELGLKSHKGRERRILEPIAVRMNRPVDDLVNLLGETAKAIRSNQCDRQTAADLIKRLSEIRAAVR